MCYPNTLGSVQKIFNAKTNNNNKRQFSNFEIFFFTKKKKKGLIFISNTAKQNYLNSMLNFYTNTILWDQQRAQDRNYNLVL